MTMEYWPTEGCLLCYKDTALIQLNDPDAGSVRQSLENLFEILDLPVKCLQDLWSVSEHSWNLSLCSECEALIVQGLEIKRKLRDIKCDLLKSARVVEAAQNDPAFAERRANSLPEVLKFRQNIASLIIQSDKPLVMWQTTTADDQGQDWTYSDIDIVVDANGEYTLSEPSQPKKRKQEKVKHSMRLEDELPPDSLADDAIVQAGGKSQRKEVNVYGVPEPYVSCVLCQAFYSVEGTGLTVHYKYFHGLECCFKDRYCCADCKEIYVARQPDVGIGKIAENDVEHFKWFVQQHLHCGEIQHMPKQYKCGLCNNETVYTSAQSLFAHDIRTHSKDPKLKCEICNLRFLGFQKFQSHVHGHGAAIRSHCGKCQESFLSRMDYYVHLKVHKPRVKTVYLCFLCEAVHQTSVSYRNHMEKEHAQKTINRRPDKPLELATEADIRKRKRRQQETKYGCFLCDSKFNTAQSLDLHLQEIHDPLHGELGYKCQCGQEFKRSDYLVRGPDNVMEYKYPVLSNSNRKLDINSFAQFCDIHVQQCLNRLKAAGRQMSMMECGKCHKHFSSEKELVTHLQSHYSELLKNCILCDFAFSDPKTVDSHMYRIHYLKRLCQNQFYCRWCRTCYNSERPDLETGRLVLDELENFKKFAKTHAACKNNPCEQLSNFKCKFCDYTVSHPRELFRHEINQHTKNYAHFCHECGTGFARKVDYNLHVRGHKDRPFKCTICPSSFLRKYRLEAHLRMHNNERPFVCHVCGKAFYDKTKLTRHEKTQHKDTPPESVPSVLIIEQAKKDGEDGETTTVEIATFQAW